MTEASQRDNDAVASVKQVIHVLAEAWNRKDPDAFAALFTDDGEWTDVLANPVQGHEAVRNLHVFPFTTAMKKAQLILNDIRIRLLKPDVASVDVTWQAIGQTTPDGSKEIPTRNGLMTLVLLQQAGDKCAIALGHHFDYTATYLRREFALKKSKRTIHCYLIMRTIARRITLKNSCSNYFVSCCRAVPFSERKGFTTTKNA